MSALVRVEEGDVTTLRLDNPPLNLVTVDLVRALDDALARLEESSHVRAVVVAGGDRAFCAGSDINEFEGLRRRVGEGKLLAEKAVYRRLARLHLPTVAAIEGDALGGGLELALCCDLRVASATARLGLPEVGLGVMPGSGGTQRLPRIVGAGRAKELILLGQLCSASEAERFGLVNRVVPPGEAERGAREYAEVLASRGPLAVQEAKAAIDMAGDLPLDAGLAAELDASERLFRSADMTEGARAFREKRPPRFEGR
ncbi:MAG: enoyl-CoA hydratase/isomerase family protein [Acidimicrobiia bacterium]